MKIRINFVSNSSSTSFVIRGIRIPINIAVSVFKADIAKLLEEDSSYNIQDEYGKLYEAISEYREDVSVECTRNYFETDSSKKDTDVIIGINILDANDGVVEEIPVGSNA